MILVSFLLLANPLPAVNVNASLITAATPFLQFVIAVFIGIISAFTAIRSYRRASDETAGAEIARANANAEAWHIHSDRRDAELLEMTKLKAVAESQVREYKETIAAAALAYALAIAVKDQELAERRRDAR